MADNAEGVNTPTTYDQDAVNALVTKAKDDAAAQAQRDLLKALGVESADAAKKRLDEAKRIADEKKSDVEKAQATAKEAEDRAAALVSENQSLSLQLKTTAMQHDAVDIGAKHGVGSTAALQVLALLGVDPATYEPGKSDLDAKFRTFLDKNKHFVGAGVTASGPISGSANRPGTGGTRTEPTKLDLLRNSIRSISGKHQG